MNLLDKLKRVEIRLSSAIEDATRSALKAAPVEPLEIIHAILARIAEEVQPAGRGTHVFPFNVIVVSIAARSAVDRARIAAVLESEPPLTERIADSLRTNGCDPSVIRSTVGYVTAAGAEWTNERWHIDFDRVDSSPLDAPLPATTAATQARLELTIVRGAGAPAKASFAQSRIDLGRCAEVLDGSNRLIRTNHVAFADQADPLNRTVSRRHAHIEFDATSGDYRLHDDRSTLGTSVVRAGRSIAIPAGARGIRLNDGDEILLGEARLKVTFVSA